MATSSITKQFVIRDPKALDRLADLEQKVLPERDIDKTNSSILEGRKLLQKFAACKKL